MTAIEIRGTVVDLSGLEALASEAREMAGTIGCFDGPVLFRNGEIIITLESDQ